MMSVFDVSCLGPLPSVAYLSKIAGTKSLDRQGWWRLMVSQLYAMFLFWRVCAHTTQMVVDHG